MVFRTNAELKAAYAKRLSQEGQAVSIDVPTNRDGGTIDILTANEIIFCAIALDKKSAIALTSQLNFYGRFSPSRAKVAVVQQVIDTEAAHQLSAAGIQVVNLSLQSEPLPKARPSVKLAGSTPLPKHTIYRYPALDSVKGGDGLQIAAITLAIVGLIGLIGVIGS